MKIKRFFLVLAAFAALLSCGEKNKVTPDDTSTQSTNPREQEYRFVNRFGKGCMEVWYLWCDEIKNDLAAWKDDVEPIAKVKRIRYKENGKDFDRWTQMTDDFEAFTNSVAGISETYGYDVGLMWKDQQQSAIIAVIRFVYAGSPADKAGLKRGDAIFEINDKVMTDKTYYKIANEELYNSKSVKLKLSDDRVIELEAEDMYEDPVLLYKTLDVAGKKIGYLVFTSFTLKSCERLIEACSYFKSEGVEELILDLRYNGGGYVFTQQVIASMLAPAANVEAGDILETTVYNKLLTQYYGNGATKLSYTHEVKVNDETLSYDTSNANIGITKLYAILDEGSASASESLLTVLMPYLPVIIVGQQSHGKFCTGVPYGLMEWYSESTSSASTLAKINKIAGNWGLYVMIGRFADKNGITPCMPDGFTPDYKAEDNPKEGKALGDPEESMLAAVIAVIEGHPAGSGSGGAAARKKNAPARVEFRRDNPMFGKYIITKGELEAQMQR